MAVMRPSRSSYDTTGLADPDVGTIADLARLHLAARRLELEVVLRNASEKLIELIAFVGLDDVLRVEPSGRPNSGNSVAASRKNVNSAIRPSESSSTCSAHGS